MENRYSEYFCRRIKSERLKQKLSLDSLASLTKISKGYLSKIENLAYNPSEIFIKNIYDKLGKNLVIGVKKTQELNDRLNSLHHMIVFYDEENAEKLFKELLSEYEIYQYSTLLIKYVLMMYIYLNSFDTSNNDISKIEKYLIKLQKEIPFIGEESQLYYDYLGVRYRNMSQYQKSVEMYEQSLSYGSFPNITSMVYYHLGKSLFYLNRLIGAFSAYEKAANLFVDENNFIRLWFVRSHIAILYCKNKQYDEAQEIELSLLNSVGMEKYKKVVKRNYVWLLINAHKYNLAIKTLSEIDIEKDKVPNNYLYLSWCYYKVGEESNAMEWVNKGMKITSKVSDVYVLLGIVRSLISHKNSSIVTILQNDYIKNERTLSTENKELVCQLIIEKAEEFHLYKVADKYYQYLFNLLFH